MRGLGGHRAAAMGSWEAPSLPGVQESATSVPSNCNLVCGRRDLARVDRVMERSWEAGLTLAPAMDICGAAEMTKTPT